MPNVLDIKPVRALAKRASSCIGDPAVAARFETIAAQRILAHPRCFRPALEFDFIDAPAWAKDAAARGETISVFRSNSGMSARLRVVARRISDVCRLAEMEAAGKPDRSEVIREAQLFVRKIAHMNFDDAARKALAIARSQEEWEGEAASVDVVPPQSIKLPNGRVWHRVTSLAALRSAGREFHNCLIRTTRSNGYGMMLIKGRGQFWVLRDTEGYGCIVACVTAPEATRFMEVKGPRNAAIRFDDPDLQLLGKALGIKPPPPRPASAGVLRALETLRAIEEDIPARFRALLDELDPQPCRCRLCQPRAEPQSRLRLRTAPH